MRLIGHTDLKLTVLSDTLVLTDNSFEGYEVKNSATKNFMAITTRRRKLKSGLQGKEYYPSFFISITTALAFNINRLEKFMVEP